MVCKGLARLVKTNHYSVLCIGATLYLCIYHPSTAGLFADPRKYRVVPRTGSSDAFLEKNSVVNHSTLNYENQDDPPGAYRSQKSLLETCQIFFVPTTWAGNACRIL